MTNKNYNVDLASLLDKKLRFDFAQEMNFDLKAQGKSSNRDRSLIKLLESPCLRVSASGVSWSHRKKSSSNTIFLPLDLNELCDRLKSFLQGKQSGSNSAKINEKIIVILDEFLEYNCKSRKQNKQSLYKCSLLHE